VVATGWEEGVSLGGVMSFMVSFAFRNSSSSSVVHELMGAVVPYLSSVVIMSCLRGFFLGEASAIVPLVLMLFVKVLVRCMEPIDPLGSDEVVVIVVVPVSRFGVQLDVELFFRSDVILSIEWLVGL